MRADSLLQQKADEKCGLGIWTPGLVWLGIGFNQPPQTYRARRLNQLLQQPGFELLSFSQFYFSQPVGLGLRGRFCNAVAVLRSYLQPRALLMTLKRLERQLGRLPNRQDRPADLDLLLWRDRIGWRQMKSPSLIVPHPRAIERNFVLRPLTELEQDYPLPVRFSRRIAARRFLKYQLPAAKMS